MAKLKNPLFGLNVRGTLGRALTFRKSGSRTIAEKTPIPEDAKSLAQLSWRHMYQKAVALWHCLSPEEQQDWESQARRKHMTGFAWFMSQCLKPNPGLYLPLQGGIMQGEINMATQKITGLPVPTADEEPTRKKELSDHADLATGIHGLATLYAAGFPTAGQQVSKLIENVTPALALSDLNRIATLGWTDLDLTAYTSVNAKFALLFLRITADVIGGGAYSTLASRKNGTTFSIVWSSNIFTYASAGDFSDLVVIQEMDSSQVIEYAITLGAGWQVDSSIWVMGHTE